MKKKVIEGARKLIKKLFEAILDREAFIFDAPKAFTRNFSRDMLTDDLFRNAAAAGAQHHRHVRQVLDSLRN